MEMAMTAISPLVMSDSGLERAPAAGRPSELLDAAQVWLGATGPGPQTRLFRRVIHSPEPIQSAQIKLFAESRYHLWFNGRYLGRGPVFHHPHRRPVSEYDLTELWQRGANVIAILVHAPNIPLHNSIPSGNPGLTARIAVTNDLGRHSTWDCDAAWRASDQAGWRTDVPRRGWALGFVEAFDANLAPGDWTHPDFDDSSWPPAQVRPPGAGRFYRLESHIRHLRWRWRPAKPLGIFAVGASYYPLHSPERADDPAAFGAALDEEPWSDDPQLRITDLANHAIRIDGLTCTRGGAVCLDLGKEYVGQIMFKCDCPSDGIIDIGWSELLVNGRPPLMRKNCTYADRLYAVEGTNHWEPINFSGARYLVLVLRGFEGPVTLRQAGMRATEADLDWIGDFHCDQQILNDVWELCAHTLRVGVQEGLMDCPTREQAPYLGDANLMGRWIGLLSGDWGHWRYLIRESFIRQSPDGLLRDAVFSGLRRSLVDYNLLAVIGARDYLRLSGDQETIRHVLPGCRHVFQWFNQRRDNQGLVRVEWEKMRIEGQWEKRYDPASDALPWATNLFIDHPGLGWHNVNEPGIDRRGINAAINALYVVAAKAMAELEEAGGNDGGAWRTAAATTAAAAARFFNPRETAFVDGIRDHGLLTQISQQTNTWCLWAGICPPGLEQAVMQRICRPNDAALTRSGPYFWAYMFPQFARMGMHRQALDHLCALWGRMVDAGATTLWETFAGDELDSRCHPWSAAPMEFLIGEVLGLGGLMGYEKSPAYRPRIDLLRAARGAIATAEGPASIEWGTGEDGSVILQGELPPGMAASLILPDGAALPPVRGSWERRITGKP
jgi:hypothetical protein